MRVDARTGTIRPFSVLAFSSLGRVSASRIAIHPQSPLPLLNQFITQVGEKPTGDAA